jgi:hypothetical protein
MPRICRVEIIEMNIQHRTSNIEQKPEVTM